MRQKLKDTRKQLEQETEEKLRALEEDFREDIEKCYGKEKVEFT
jgi:hypothetical protein